jgi:hypothetical protein
MEKKPDKVKITVEIDKNLYRLLKIMSASNGITMKRLIHNALHHVYAQ